MSKQMEGALSAEQGTVFRRSLAQWYKAHARVLPWRGVDAPYLTWVSEIMLQQTRVNAVLEHYRRFVERFPTAIALALAPEEEVLAQWSGLGYYRRARMLHRAAQFLVEEHNGELPRTSAELRRLPGIGDYTAAAVASIAFGECIAVVDGNVERVLLRVTGRAEDASRAGREFVQAVAQALVHPKNPGDHNQAMMELGATVCTPVAPRCSDCPVFALCRTRGEHTTLPRGKMLSQTIAYGLWTRKIGRSTEVLLTRRGATESLMSGMLELPPLSGPVPRVEPMLRVRHSITKTNYYVEVYGMSAQVHPAPSGGATMWVRDSALHAHPLTGLARKVLERVNILDATKRAVQSKSAAQAKTLREKA